MSDTVIRVENLGKKYIIGHQKQERYTALRDVLANKAKSVSNRLLTPLNKKNFESNFEEFWALKDVSFEIKRGDRVGIIGRNGAGKSTLLKVLSRITEPTQGRISIKGRVASLLEVGTGFHPELTGRENIYLNGAILGMSKAEIKKKFDEIVAFAEVEKFLDTPVKRYSSGMYVRLAFAVAAHLEPEILVVDEVLAVGDAAFQKKCLGKMEDVGREGRTVLFVSHNMSAVRQLCNKAYLLAMGKIAYFGTSSEAIIKYMEGAVSLFDKINNQKIYNHLQSDGRVEIEKIIINNKPNVEVLVSIYDKIKISIDYSVKAAINKLEFFVLIYSSDGEVQLSLFQRDSQNYVVPQATKGTVNLEFQNCLMPGRYFISAGIFDQNKQFVDWVEQVESFCVEETFSDGRIYDYRLGKISVIGHWYVN